MRYKYFILLAVAVLFSSCDMDSYLFNTENLDNYNLSNAVIPDSMRELVSFQSGKNTLYGYFIKSNRQNVIADNHTVFYFHGNKHNIQEYWDRVEILYNAGFSVFIFDYSGFGKSEGTASESQLYADARSARNYLLSVPGIDTSKIIYYGYSLGCVAAIDLAVQFSPKRLILEAPFASGETVVKSGTLLDIPGAFVLKGEFNNKEKIKNVYVPVAVIQGVDDKFIDIDKNGAVVYNNANNPKMFVRVPGADHTNVPQIYGIDKYEDFLYKVLNWQ